jgi:checkpoint serine/threonine-protein kinase
MLPNQLTTKRRKIAPDSQVFSGFVSRELGRGMNGIVFLLDVEKITKIDKIAVKAQPSAASLAWEWKVLQSIEDRIERHNNSTIQMFPRPLTFVSCLDGAMMGLSAASDSGINLVDLSNWYRSNLREEVPECIVLHYLACMLKVIDQLHCKAMIIHCDVKPDNWVLSGTRHKDLTLVDFGRAIDVAQVSQESQRKQNVTFSGKATNEDMECVSMRCGDPWSYDADYFGLLQSVHVLLYGRYLTLRQGNDGSWKPTTRLKRYWKNHIWTEVFDLMLNASTSSTLVNLRSLLATVETELHQEAGSINQLLQRQASLLPNSREKICPIG